LREPHREEVVTLRTRELSRQWAVDGGTQVIHAIDGLGVADYDVPSLLPGWSRRHVVAHLASNAEALHNLVRWARTGTPTPMYASPQERAAGIERGTGMSPAALDSWLRDADAALVASWNGLDDERWSADVVTAQGRTVPASDIPWLRAREVWVHLVDLNRGTRFDDVPRNFLQALRHDVCLKRGDVPAVSAPLPEEVAWLTGRPHTIPDAPTIPPWL
jgi:maleylpyruvate isomerase